MKATPAMQVSDKSFTSDDADSSCVIVSLFFIPSRMMFTREERISHETSTPLTGNEDGKGKLTDL
jgi:hypothetical protein